MNTRIFPLKASRALLAMTLLLVAATVLLGLPAVKAAATANDAKATTASTAASLPEGVVAKVNGRIITRDELAWAANAKLRKQGMDLGGMRNPGAYKSLKRRVLKRLIQEELILEAADNQGLTIDDARVDARIQEDQASYETEAEFANHLQSLDLAMAEHREHTRRRLLLEEYVRVNIQPRVEIDDVRVDAAYADYLEEQKDAARPEHEVRMLIRSQLGQQLLAELISEHLETLRENSEVRIDRS